MRRVGTSLDYFRNEPHADAYSKQPGQHAHSRRSKTSVYGDQLKSKQTIRYFYGLREKQFRSLYKKADKMKGSTGLNLMRLLETRLDNLVYRMGFASTRAQARQFVNHGLILVQNQKKPTPQRVDIASYRVNLGDKISMVKKMHDNVNVKDALQYAQERKSTHAADSEWLTLADENTFTGVLNALPELDHLPQVFNPSHVVELYSK